MLSDNEQTAPGPDAIKTILAAYRSSEAHITEAQITAAWAAYQEACDLEASVRAVEAERDERLTLDESRTIAFRCTEAERERDTFSALRDPSEEELEASDIMCALLRQIFPNGAPPDDQQNDDEAAAIAFIQRAGARFLAARQGEDKPPLND